MSLLRRLLATGGALLLVSASGSAMPPAHADDPTDKPVHGTSEQANAPMLTAGRYTDASPASDPKKTELHYRVKRQWKNSSIRVNAIVQKPDEGGSTSNGGTVWRFELSTPNDELCDSSSGNAVDREKPGLQLSKTLLALQLDPKKTSPEATEKVCAGADELIYKVGVERFPGAKGEMPFEIQVIEEPPAENADQLPAGVPEVPKDGSSSPAPKGTDTPQPVTGGTSFDDAVELSSGSYAVQVTTNEKVFCKTRIDYGRQGTFSLDQLELSQSLINQAGNLTMVNVIPDVYAPDFSQMNSNKSSGVSNYSVSMESGVEQKDPVINQVPEVRFRNRWDSPTMSDDKSRGFSMSGYYYYVLGTESTAQFLKDQATKIYFSINVAGDVTGQPTTTATASPTGGTASQDDQSAGTSTKLGLLVAGSGLVVLGGGGVTYTLLRRRG